MPYQFCEDSINQVPDTKGIYRIFKITDNKSYIGKSDISLRKRLKHHYRALKNDCHHNKYLQNSFNKNNEEFFCFELLQQFEISEEIDLNILEQKYIKQYDSYAHGYNLTLGGEGVSGLIVSEETRKLQSQAKMGFIPWNAGKTGLYTASEETRRKLSEASRQVYGEAHSQASLTEEQVIIICERIIAGETTSSIGKDYGKTVVLHIRYGNSWKHIVNDYIHLFPTPHKDIKQRKQNLSAERVYEVYLQLKNKKKVAKFLGVGVTFVNEMIDEFKRRNEIYANYTSISNTQ